MRNLKSISVYFVALTCVLLLLFGCSKTVENTAYNQSAPTPVPTQEALGIILEPKSTQTPTPKPMPKVVDVKNEATAKPQKENNIMVFNEGTQAQNEATAPPQDEKNYCSLVVSCETILDNMDKLKKEMHRLVPDNGIILSKEKVEFNEGESAFNVLQRELKRAKIHMEFVDTPVYNSVYVEGINNLYEFDCGSESGWSYSVNDWIPNYGISQYNLKNGDKIKVFYICDRNEDIF